MIGGATWLITGGTGFFGQRFARHLLDQCHPHAVRILSRSESRQAAMEERFGDFRLRFLLGDVRDTSRMVRACDGVDFLVHAAALKRVDGCERDPWEAVETNVQGTRTVASAAIDAQVHRAVFLSTDKAPQPDTLYGATKLVAERLWVQSNVYAANRPTRFAVTRYGNVLGSTGSVVEVWRSQASSGTITVTDPTATRFWMTPTDACELVVHAFEQMQGGEIFVPVLRGASLGVLAAAVAPAAVQQQTGLRGPEKHDEVLLTSAECLRAVRRGKVLVVQPTAATWTSGTSAGGTPVGTQYRSDLVDQWTVAELQEVLRADCGH